MENVHNLQSLLKSLCTQTTGETVSVGDLLNAVGRRSYGPVILLLGFIAISPLTLVPGANSLVAVVILIFALQMVIGRAYPWLPKKALEFSFPRKHLLAGAEALDKHAHTVDQLLKPRFTFLTRAPFVQLVALALVGAALVTIPLSFIPLGPVLPSLTVLLFGLAITARDGFLLVLAGATLVGAVLLMIRAWSVLPFV
ncbi:exopolysaccharide biosynthesis protein [Hyphomonas sp. FCG-A18]|uniref:exopolysaccharide biosynthesis protein n=1 Tax=Hyphomonas sp. FCG-A18 TaxID=3080019 RepID=UPI002B2C7016|nr:exopolysaccharide biosynthesis protein [Hyphomonas sp. FCG-A18]